MKLAEQCARHKREGFFRLWVVDFCNLLSGSYGDTWKYGVTLEMR